MEYKEAESYLLAIPKFASKTSHDNLRGFLERLQNPQDSIPAIHIAGTNGKGSTCAFLSSILRQAGCHVGMFTSPHLQKINERFTLDGEMISDQEFVDAFVQVKAVVDQGIVDGLIHPNFFEYIFMMALCWYRRKNDEQKEGRSVDFVIYETGLGGRLDATNILKPCMTIITSIGMDHMQYLGDTIAQIATEKAGILKEAVPCVYLGGDTVASKVIEDTGKRLQIPMIDVESDRIIVQKCDGDWIDFMYLTKYDKEDNIAPMQYRIRKTALFQLENAALAMEAGAYILRNIWLQDALEEELEEKDVRNQRIQTCICQGLETMYWKGRMEELFPGFYIDGAHNEPAIRAFCDTVSSIYQDKKIILLFAVSSDKSYNEMIRILCNRLSFEEVIVTAILGARTTPVTDVEKIFASNTEAPVVCIEDLRSAYEYAKTKISKQNRVFCVGSLYLVGSLLEYADKDIESHDE